MLLRWSVAALLLLPGAAALAAPDLQLTWESEASAGKLVMAGTVTTPTPVAKGAALHLEVHRAGDAPEKAEAEGEAAKKAKKLKFVIKGVGEGSYQVRVWVDVDGDGACGAGDFDGWYAATPKAKEAVLAQADAAAVELQKKPNRKVDFVVAAVAEGAAPTAAAAPAEAAAPAAAGAPVAPAAPAGKPAWVQQSSGPWLEGEARCIIGISFGPSADPAAADGKARSALRDKNEDFAMLLANQFQTSRAQAPQKPTEAEIAAVTEAWRRSSAQPDAVAAWMAPEGTHHAMVRTDLPKVLERLAADTAVAEPLRAWLQGAIASVHEVFTQLER